SAKQTTRSPTRTPISSVRSNPCNRLMGKTRARESPTYMDPVAEERIPMDESCVISFAVSGLSCRGRLRKPFWPHYGYREARWDRLDQWVYPGSCRAVCRFLIGSYMRLGRCGIGKRPEAAAT